MPCYHPITGYQHRKLGGQLLMRPPRRGDAFLYNEVPVGCGQCIGCRLERSRQWAMRCMHEASLYDFNAFATLTFDNEHLPPGANLDFRPVQLFQKRLRKRLDGQQIRIFGCMEYGGETLRPHAHMCIFNVRFPDPKLVAKGKAGDRLFESQLLSDAWGQGMANFGEVTFEAAAYVARYSVSKVTGDQAQSHYRRIDEQGREYQVRPEFGFMSRRPGIGRPWLDKWMTDVYPHDYVIVNGMPVKPPKFYDNILAHDFPDNYLGIKAERLAQALANAADATPQRLAVREEVATARLNLKGGRGL